MDECFPLTKLADLKDDCSMTPEEFDEAAKMADALSLEAGVEDALLAAEEIARRCGEPDLADCLARVHMLRTIGATTYAVKLLDRARDACLEALREVTDEIQP